VLSDAEKRSIYDRFGEGEAFIRFLHWITMMTMVDGRGTESCWWWWRWFP
jgi:hypothetical protein